MSIKISNHQLQNQVVSYQLPCGISMKGTHGYKRQFTKKFELHRRYCVLCKNITLNEFNNPGTDEFFQGTATGLTQISHIESCLKKYGI